LACARVIATQRVGLIYRHYAKRPLAAAIAQSDCIRKYALSGTMGAIHALPLAQTAMRTLRKALKATEKNIFYRRKPI
jgi:hypothetical protein